MACILTIIVSLTPVSKVSTGNGADNAGETYEALTCKGKQCASRQLLAPSNFFMEIVNIQHFFLFDDPNNAHKSQGSRKEVVNHTWHFVHRMLLIVESINDR